MNSGRLRVLLLISVDALTLSVCWLLAAGGYALLANDASTVRYLFSRGGFLVVYLCLNAVTRLYHGNPFYPGMALPPVEEFRRLVLTSLGTGILFFAYLSFYGKASPLPSWVVVLAVFLNILVAQPMRNALRALLRRIKLAQIPVVLVGPKAETRHLFNLLDASPYTGLTVRGTFEKTQAALTFAQTRDIKHCISCQPLRVFRVTIHELLGWFSVLVCMPEPQIFPIAMTHSVEFGGYGGLEMANQLRQRGIRSAKRVVEFLGATVAGILCLIPGVLIALTLWACSGFRGGGVFYRTERLGKGGRPFTCWKFRTMVPDAEARLAAMLDSDPQKAREWELTGKLRDDPRVTRMGVWLRKTSLDEIPQLLNVLRGEMALIGPRPIVSREVPHYGRYYAIVSAVKPGITGLWQVSGRSDVGYDTRVALDLYYAQNWSLWLDLWIFLKTFAVVLFQRGAC